MAHICWHICQNNTRCNLRHVLNIIWIMLAIKTTSDDTEELRENVISLNVLTSMLTGADVRGWRYSGCSKWPLCAVNIFMIRMGSLLAWRKGSVGEGQDAGMETDSVSAPVRCGSPLVCAALRSGYWLRKSGSGPPGGSLIWIGARNGTAACNEWTLGWNSFTSTFHDDKFNRRECGNPEGHVRSARPPCPTRAVSKEEQIARMSSSNRLFNITS